MLKILTAINHIIRPVALDYVIPIAKKAIVCQFPRIMIPSETRKLDLNLFFHRPPFFFILLHH